MLTATLILLLSLNTLPKVPQAEEINMEQVQITKVNHPSIEAVPGNTIPFEITFNNPMKKNYTVKVIWEIADKNGKKVNTLSKTISLPAKQEKTEKLSWVIPNALDSGHYYSKFQALIPPSTFDEVPILLKSPSVAAEKGHFVLFKNQDEFEEFDTEFWHKSSHKLGWSKLVPEQVITQEGLLIMSLLPGNFSGGEIQTQKLMGDGLYEVKMKLPNAPSSITGFFLYEPPDYYYEVDIEILNDSSGTFYLTTYADGKVSNTYEGSLGFDPTMDFHRYRIEYSINKVSFYVDGKWVKAWTDGIPQKPMRLMLNVWYPKWLEGKAAKSETALFVDWIRF